MTQLRLFRPDVNEIRAYKNRKANDITRTLNSIREYEDRAATIGERLPRARAQVSTLATMFSPDNDPLALRYHAEDRLNDQLSYYRSARERIQRNFHTLKELRQDYEDWEKRESEAGGVKIIPRRHLVKFSEKAGFVHILTRSPTRGIEVFFPPAPMRICDQPTLGVFDGVQVLRRGYYCWIDSDHSVAFAPHYEHDRPNSGVDNPHTVVMGGSDRATARCRTIREYRRPCFGDFATPINDALCSDDIYTALGMIFDFLSQVNLPDAACASMKSSLYNGYLPDSHEIEAFKGAHEGVVFFSLHHMKRALIAFVAERAQLASAPGDTGFDPSADFARANVLVAVVRDEVRMGRFSPVTIQHPNTPITDAPPGHYLARLAPLGTVPADQWQEHPVVLLPPIDRRESPQWVQHFTPQHPLMLTYTALDSRAHGGNGGSHLRIGGCWYNTNWMFQLIPLT